VLEDWNVERSPFLEEIENRGQLRTARTYVELVLRTRLRQGLPGDLLEIIQQQMDQATLDRWLTEAATIDTLQQARDLLGRTGE
jgi:hypothetical protein